MERALEEEEHAQTSKKLQKRLSTARRFELSPKNTQKLSFDTIEASAPSDPISPLNVPVHQRYGFSTDPQVPEKQEESGTILSTEANYGPHHHQPIGCGSIATKVSQPPYSTTSLVPGVPSPSSYDFWTDIHSPLKPKEGPSIGSPPPFISPPIFTPTNGIQTPTSATEWL